MNSEKINTREALLTFEKIQQYGAKTESGYILDGIRAESDFDGYTAFLKNEYVTLTLLFHNKFEFEYTNQRERNLFLEKIEKIARMQGGYKK